VLSIHKSRRCSFDRPGKCDRESKHHVNCPLDYDTKMRLQRATLENDGKMTVIMKAAIGDASGFLCPDASVATSLFGVKSFKHLLQRFCARSCSASNRLRRLLSASRVASSSTEIGLSTVQACGFRSSFPSSELFAIVWARARFRGVPVDVVRRWDAGWLSCT